MAWQARVLPHRRRWMRLTLSCLFALAILVALTGCVPTGGGSLNPNFAGSMKLEPGVFPPPPPLGDLPVSRVREGD
jgi:hypothetical protein